jgi:hypothetical protein
MAGIQKTGVGPGVGRRSASHVIKPVSDLRRGEFSNPHIHLGK